MAIMDRGTNKKWKWVPQSKLDAVAHNIKWDFNKHF